MTPEGKIMHARMQVRKDHPFAGDILVYLQPKMTDQIETMGVTAANELYANPTWTMELKPPNVKVVIIHEVLHLMLLHPFRNPVEIQTKIDTRQPLTVRDRSKLKIFNYACDLKINFMFHEMGNFDDLPETDFKPDKEGNWDCRRDGSTYKIKDIPGKSAERIYYELLRQFEENDPGFFNGTSDLVFVLTDDHGKWPDGTDAKSAREAAADWMVRSAGALLSGKGNMPASLVRAIEDMLTPKIGWQDKLQKYMQPLVAAGYSYRRPRRSSWVTGIILPGQDREGIHIIAHVDTSGSMGKNELEQILAELYGILDAYPNVRITLLISDAGAPTVTELRETDKEDILSNVVFTGGGGTSHRPVVDWVLNKNDEEVKALICFTDGASDIEACFDRIPRSISRMLVVTREAKMETLKEYCEEIIFLPVA